nr:MAG TPA: hypothetical protein [Caudoviricetes sp.]
MKIYLILNKEWLKRCISFRILTEVLVMIRTFLNPEQL